MIHIKCQALFFYENWEKKALEVLSAAVVIGALMVNTVFILLPENTSRDLCQEKQKHFNPYKSLNQNISRRHCDFSFSEKINHSISCDLSAKQTVHKKIKKKLYDGVCYNFATC